LRHGGKRGLSASQQLLHLQRNPICAGVGQVKCGLLTWRYWAKPTALSRDYLIRIELRDGAPPIAIVDTPDLVEIAAGRQIPHIYGEAPLRLCLYLPGTGEWERHLRIDQTIVPWTYLWLGYFEEWLWSNEWKGGGEHPEPGPRPSRLRIEAGRP
jgi:hypothetical protein